MRFAAIVIGSIGILFAGPALAQTSRLVAPKSVVPPMSEIDVQDVQGRRDMLFQIMLEQPDDLDAAFEYAALSVKAGDLEAAVSTLERMLIFAPGLPRLQLELGVLYYRLSAYETARSYFEAAVSGPDVPEEVKGKVEQYLTAIDYAGRTTRFAGQVRAGIRYQTNANRAPTDGVVILNGSPFVLDRTALGSPDGNVYGASVLHYSADLPSQGDTLEADLVTYGSKQFHREDLDVVLGELTVGPAFDLRRFGIDNGAIGVYGIASTVFIEGHFYSTGFGAGTRLVLQPSAGFSWTTAVEYRQRDYHNSEASPTAELRDGGEIRAYTYVNYVVSPTLLWTGNAYVQYDSAKADYLAYTEAGFSAGPSIAFDAPIGEGDPWIFSPNAGLVYRSYDSPDPIVSLSEAEHDLELFIGADLTDSLQGRLGLAGRNRIPARRFQLFDPRLRQSVHLTQRREEFLNMMTERKRLPTLRCSPLRRTLAACAAVSAIVLCASGAEAKVGVAAAVNTDARGKAPGQQQRVITLGQTVIFDEEIATDAKGLVQVLLLDGTTFTVGPNSRLKIDKFVYNPDSGDATVVATLTKGTFRFIGGQTSRKPGGATINTPVGTIGIRGAMVEGSVTSSRSALFSMIFGSEVRFIGPGGITAKIFRPGYTLTVLDGAGGLQTDVRPRTQADASTFQTALAGTHRQERRRQEQARRQHRDAE